MRLIDLIGWGSALILVATIGAQVARQWRERTIAGVSPWLYVGQGSASAGLLVYSILLGNWVFVCLNSAMALAATIGFLSWWRMRRASANGELRANCVPKGSQ